MRANRHFHIAAIVVTALFFVWFQAAVAETPVQQQLGALVQVHPECEEALSIVENSAPVPQTGQTTCYDNYGAEIDCLNTGQDGDLQMGVPWDPASRFTDNENGTVTDNLTGLIWLKDAGCIGEMLWENALSASSTLAHGNVECGLDDNSAAGDWRLPNIRELHSLIDFSQPDPDIPASTRALPLYHPFENVAAYYWSSTTFADNTVGAWDVSMDYGYVFHSNKVDYLYHVWPVRGGN